MFDGLFRAAAELAVHAVGVKAQLQKRLLKPEHLRAARAVLQRFIGSERRIGKKHRRHQRQRKNSAQK